MNIEVEKVIKTLRSSIEMYEKSIAEAERKSKFDIAKHFQMEKELLEEHIQSLENSLLVPKEEEKTTIENVTDEMYKNTIYEMKKRGLDAHLVEEAKADTEKEYSSKFLELKPIYSDRFDLEFRDIPSHLVKSVEITSGHIAVSYYETEDFDVFGYFNDIFTKATEYYDPLCSDVLKMEYFNERGKTIRTDIWRNLAIEGISTTERNYKTISSEPIITEVVFGYKNAK